MTQNTLFMATVEKVLTRVLGDHDPRSAQAKWTSQTTWKPFRLSQSAPNHKEDFQHNFFSGFTVQCSGTSQSNIACLIGKKTFHTLKNYFM